MDFGSSDAGRKGEIRPPPCPVCGNPSWRDGCRSVAQMDVEPDGDVFRREGVVRLRVRCANRACEYGSWTIYEPGGYPHRTFTLSVAASAVAELAASPEATMTSVAQRRQCDRRTVGRWVRWVGGLGEPQALGSLCVRIDPSGLPPPTHALADVGYLTARTALAGWIHGPPSVPFPGLARIARAGLLVLLLEHLAKLLRDRGVPLETGSGLAAILRHQFGRFRAVSFLTRASPPLRVEWAWAEI